MNPPTPGHLDLIEQLINKALQTNTDRVFIILSKTVDDKNPLSCENPGTEDDLSYKRELIAPMVQGLKQKMRRKNEMLNADSNQ
jgi:hypothetical protein